MGLHLQEDASSLRCFDVQFEEIVLKSLLLGDLKIGLWLRNNFSFPRHASIKIDDFHFEIAA